MLSEVMLQQTQVATVIPYFERFLKAFPSLASLANADEAMVLKQWEGLGYYRRARYLHQAAKLIMKNHGGKIPGKSEILRTLPGIGDYSAAAVASIAFGERVVALDGNALRVFSRLFAMKEDVHSKKLKQGILESVSPLLQNANCGDFNQAVMELGASCCKPKRPNCSSCPVGEICQARALRIQEDLPMRKSKKSVPHHDIAVGVLWRKDKILVQRRPADKMLGGLWEFPGGKQIEGESPENAVVREVFEETGFQVQVLGSYGAIKHAYSHFRITLHAFDCRIVSGRLRSHDAEEARFVSLKELDRLAFPSANRKLIEKILFRSGTSDLQEA